MRNFPTEAAGVWLVLGSDVTGRRLALALRKRGISARSYPVVVRSLNGDIGRALSSIGMLDTSIFTSQKAVELVSLYASGGVRKAIRRSVCFAIGPATAHTVRKKLGKRVVRVPREFTSGGLISLLMERKIGRCALFSSEKRSDELLRFLRRHSVKLHVPVLYDLRFEPSLIPQVATAIKRRCKGVVFTCSTAFEGIPDDLLTDLEKINVVAMGTRTAVALRRKGLTVTVPAKSSVQGLVSLVGSIA
jgi:uroporphyrinogen-III synthase